MGVDADGPQLIRVDNYSEAAGVMLAMTASISFDSIRRPLKSARVSGRHAKDECDLDEPISLSVASSGD